MDIEHEKVFYMFEGLTDDVLPGETVRTIRSFLGLQNVYLSAIRAITTKLENLNDEFKYTMDRNPINRIKTRVKTPKSILEKLLRRGHELSSEAARENLDDIAGVRVICSYIDDIYLIARLLLSQDDIELIRTSDYIKNPKPNGYRSLHLIVSVPVFLSEGSQRIKVEIQIRTIAMEFWASLEHELAYKLKEGKTEEIIAELRECAEVIADTDQRMQKLHDVTVSQKISIFE